MSYLYYFFMKRISKTKKSGNAQGKYSQRVKSKRPADKKTYTVEHSRYEKPNRVNKESSEIFKNLFFNGPAMMVITDAKTGIVLEVNRQFVKFYGFRKKEIIGKTLKEMNAYVNPTDRDNIT